MAILGGKKCSFMSSTWRGGCPTKTNDPLEPTNWTGVDIARENCSSILQGGLCFCPNFDSTAFLGDTSWRWSGIDVQKVGINKNPCPLKKAFV